MSSRRPASRPSAPSAQPEYFRRLLQHDGAVVDVPHGSIHRTQARSYPSSVPPAACTGNVWAMSVFDDLVEERKKAVAETKKFLQQLRDDLDNLRSDLDNLRSDTSTEITSLRGTAVSQLKDADERLSTQMAALSKKVASESKRTESRLAEVEAQAKEKAARSPGNLGGSIKKANEAATAAAQAQASLKDEMLKMKEMQELLRKQLDMLTQPAKLNQEQIEEVNRLVAEKMASQAQELNQQQIEETKRLVAEKMASEAQLLQNLIQSWENDSAPSTTGTQSGQGADKSNGSGSVEEEPQGEMKDEDSAGA